MVEPDREIPGRVAKTWATPIATESWAVMLRAVLMPFTARSARVRSRAVTRKKHPSAMMLLSVEKPLMRSWTKGTTSSGRQERTRK